MDQLQAKFPDVIFTKTAMVNTKRRLLSKLGIAKCEIKLLIGFIFDFTRYSPCVTKLDGSRKRLVSSMECCPEKNRDAF